MDNSARACCHVTLFLDDAIRNQPGDPGAFPARRHSPGGLGPPPRGHSAPPSGLPARILAELLRTLQSAATVAELQTLAADHDADESVITALIIRLVNDGVVTAV